MTALSLYLHIPFCAARCPFCDFAVVTEAPSARYVDALIREIRGWGARLGRPRLATLHLGGGTPSLLPLPMTGEILAVVREAFDVDPAAEVALECNPEDADADRLASWRGMGVGRLSIGAQSFDSRELGWIGRGHGTKEIFETVALARKVGFSNVSLDLMYGLPGQTEETWESTLREALSLGPEHVSVYAMTLTGGKKLQGPPPPSEKAQAVMAACAMDRLEAAGIRQYEISNFARPGFESRHNLAYWTFRPYLGLGVSAHSYLPPKRFANVVQASAYVDRVLAGADPKVFEEELTEEQVALERLFLGLRLSEGAELGLFKRAGEVRSLEEEGLVERKGGSLLLTRRGRVLADAVTERLMGSLA